MSEAKKGCPGKPNSSTHGNVNTQNWNHKAKNSTLDQSSKKDESI